MTEIQPNIWINASNYDVISVINEKLCFDKGKERTCYEFKSTVEAINKYNQVTSDIRQLGYISVYRAN